MRSFLLVYKNEILKLIYRKTAILLLLIVSVLMLAMGFVQRSEYRFTDTKRIEVEQNSALSTLNTSLNVKKRNLDSYMNNTIVPLLNQGELNDLAALNLLTYAFEYYQVVARVWGMEMKIEYGVALDTDFRMDIVSEMVAAKAKIDTYDYVKAYNCTRFSSALVFYNSRIGIKDDAEKEEQRQTIERYKSIVINADFDAYCEYEINRLEAIKAAGPGYRDGSMGAPLYSEEELDIRIEIVRIRQENGITGLQRSHKAFFTDVNSLFSYKEMLETYESYGAPQDMIDELKEKINTLEYYIEHNIYNYGKNNVSEFKPGDSVGFAKTLMEIARILLSLIAIVLASTSISREIETGSVKLLLVSPVKRHKVVLAKFCAILTVMLASLVWMAIIITVSTGIAAGFDAFHPYLFVNANGAVGIPFILFVLAYSLIMIIPIAWFVALGLQLSSVIRNSVGAMLLSVVILAASVMVDIVAYEHLHVFLLQYIPTVPLAQFSSAIFTYGEVLPLLKDWVIDSSVITDGLGILFAFGYVIALTGAMLFTASDSFSRRDIK